MRSPLVAAPPVAQVEGFSLRIKMTAPNEVISGLETSRRRRGRHGRFESFGLEAKDSTLLVDSRRRAWGLNRLRARRSPFGGSDRHQSKDVKIMRSVRVPESGWHL